MGKSIIRAVQQRTQRILNFFDTEKPDEYRKKRDVSLVSYKDISAFIRDPLRFFSVKSYSALLLLLCASARDPFLLHCPSRHALTHTFDIPPAQARRILRVIL
jgi:hypothetical protein